MSSPTYFPASSPGGVQYGFGPITSGGPPSPPSLPASSPGGVQYGFGPITSGGPPSPPSLPASSPGGVQYGFGPATSGGDGLAPQFSPPPTSGGEGLAPQFSPPAASGGGGPAPEPIPPAARGGGAGNNPLTHSVSGTGIFSGGTVALVLVAGGFVALALVWVYMAWKRPKSKLWTCCGCCGLLYSSHDSARDDLEMQFQEPKAAGGAGESDHKLPVSRHPEGSKLPLSRHPEGSKSFTYEELVEATNAFSPENLLGEGGFGRVYKGTIAGKLVAVKQLKTGSNQGEREFRAEVDIISRIHHRHLVSLVGFCISGFHRLLVCKYVPNGTLDEALHGLGKPVMDWATRMNIALGTARGLAYLHEYCRPRIIHRDIKGSNILLDSEWQAQLADFGLARLADDTQTHVTTRVMGTFGYVAPEYAMTGKLTDKSDVYSFGVVLLELITGKKPIDKTLCEAGGEESLVEWMRPLLTQALETGNMDAVVDANLMGKYDKEEMARMVQIAAACVRHSSQKRPKMVETLRNLSTKDADLNQGVLPGYSMNYFPGTEGDEELNLMRRFHQMVYRSSTTQSSTTDSDTKQE